MVQHNLRLVDFWARRLIEHTSGAKEVSYYELVTEGVIGLTKAVENYDGSSSFIKYAQPYIRSELYKGLTHLRPGSFLSHNTVMTSFKVHRMKQRLTQYLQRPPSDQELAAAMKMTVKNLKRTIHDVQSKRTVISGETPLSSDRLKDGAVNTNKYFDLFLRADQDLASHASDQLEWKMNFRQALDCLTPMERRTITIRYGLDDGITRSIEHTAQLMCLSAEGIRQVVGRAMEKLRSSPYSSQLQEGPPPPPLTTSGGRLGLVSSY